MPATTTRRKTKAPTVPTVTTSAAPPPRCVHCTRLIGEPVGRGMCKACYSDAAIRSMYSTAGVRLPTPATRPVRHDEDDFDPFRRGPDRHMAPAEQRAPLDPRAQQQADDEALLAGVLEVTRERVNVQDDGTPAASVTAAARRAGLPTAHRANAAAARLVAAGRARSVRVWLNPHGPPAPGVGRTAAGLVALG
jgi:hypothetical protein